MQKIKTVVSSKRKETHVTVVIDSKNQENAEAMMEAIKKTISKENRLRNRSISYSIFCQYSASALNDI